MATARAPRGGRPRTQGWAEDPLVTVSVHLRKHQLAALDRLADRIPLMDLRLCITAMHIQRETGGNLGEILEKVSHTIRARYKLMEDFRTLTTASRGSAWILCVLPLAIIALLTAINPDHTFSLLHEQRGHYVLAVAAILQILGVITIRKILDIKV